MSAETQYNVLTNSPASTQEHNYTLLLSFFHLTLLATILPSFYYLVQDYKAYISLGPGGTPSTPIGYLKIRFLALFALKDPYAPAPIHPHYEPGVLSSLPKRNTPRPLVAGIAPHRQLTQRIPSTELFDKLATALRTLARENPTDLAVGTSCFEKHGLGLFSLAPVVRTCRGEICHVHPSDGSMHMCLHPADAKILLESGWGERHPLSRGGWLRRFVPWEFVMVYAPRTEEDVQVLIEVVKASAWWVAGRKVGDKGARDKENIAFDGNEAKMAENKSEMVGENCDFKKMGGWNVQI